MDAWPTAIPFVPGQVPVYLAGRESALRELNSLLHYTKAGARPESLSTGLCGDGETARCAGGIEARDHDVVDWLKPAEVPDLDAGHAAGPLKRFGHLAGKSKLSEGELAAVVASALPEGASGRDVDERRSGLAALGYVCSGESVALRLPRPTTYVAALADR